MRDSDQADPEGVFEDGDVPFSAADCEYSKGISIWVLGRCERAEGESKTGPLPGAACPPYRLEEGSGDSREVGRPRVTHAFLDEARSRLRVHRKKRKPLPLCWDRLRNFRKEVWFLILAGYSPSFIRTFFLAELPNLFPSLSYYGVVTSVEKTVAVARAGDLLLGEDYRDVLEHYRAGPWVHNAPDWLRKQYGVPLVGEGQIVDIEVSSKSSSGKQKASGKVVPGTASEPGPGQRSEPVVGLEQASPGVKDLAGFLQPGPGGYTPFQLLIMEGLFKQMVAGLGGAALVPAGAGGVGAGGGGTGGAPRVVSLDGVISPVSETGGLSEKSRKEKRVELDDDIASYEESHGSLALTPAEYFRALDLGLSVVLAERSSGIDLISTRSRLEK